MLITELKPNQTFVLGSKGTGAHFYDAAECGRVK
jgi:hypothetical protein